MRYNKLSIISFMFLGAMLFSCTPGINEVFEESAANRVSSKINEYREILTSSENGWVMEYYAEGKGRSKIGGFNMFLQFGKDGYVTIMSDYPSGGYEEGTIITSEYDLLSDHVVMLTFNTYNPILHYYCEPHGSSDVNGYQGDYEFHFKSVTDNEIILEGKKVGLTIRMTRINKEDNPKTLLETMVKTRQQSDYHTYTLEIDGDSVGYVSNVSGLATIYLDDVEIVENFIYTGDGGIKFYKPIKINNDSIQYFKWENENSSFVNSESSSTIKFVKKIIDGYQLYTYYIGEFVFEYKDGDRVIHIEENVQGKSYLVKGLFEGLDIVLKYNSSTGFMTFNSQPLVPYKANTLALIAWDSDGGASHMSFNAGGIFTPDPANPEKLLFIDNGWWGKTNAFRLYEINQSSYVGSYTQVQPNRYAGPIYLTKKQ